MRKLLINVLVVASLLLGRVVPAMAVVIENGNGGGEPSALTNFLGKYLPVFSTSSGPCAAGDAPEIAGLFCILGKIISILLAAGGGVALLFLIFGGLRYMASGGDEKAITAAKAAITYSVLGFIIIVGVIFGINILLTTLLP